MDVENLRKKLSEFGQEHLLKFWDKKQKEATSEVETTNEDDLWSLGEKKSRFYDELMSLDLGKITNFFKVCTEEAKSGARFDAFVEPLPADVVTRVKDLSVKERKEYEDRGLKEISEGRVAVLLLAGGQGTRLGVSYPKGMYNVGLPSGKTLYQIQAERIIKVQDMAAKATGKTSTVVPWYVMTSEHTQEETERFFKQHNYFSLNPSDIVFFEQNTLPCMTEDGKIILEQPFKISRAPDGNGGLYKAVEDRGLLSELRSRGVQYIHVYCVDNILVRMADPLFIGYAVCKGLNCAAKVVEKADPAEPVGVVCGIKEGGHCEGVGGRYGVIEYSDISKEVSELREGEGGKLLYRAGGIANHFITTDFLEHIVKEKETLLKHHVARKKIPYCGVDGITVKPSANNGIKMEKFVFDIFPFSDKFGVWEVERGDEFAPLKNAEGAPVDTPSTSRAALLSMHGRWVINNGGTFLPPDSSVPEGEKEFCEISARISYGGEALEEVVNGRTFTPLCVIDENNTKQ